MAAAVTIQQAFQNVNPYPINLQVLQQVASLRGLTLTATLTPEIAQSAAYNLALADLYNWIALAPNISQGGQSYSLTDAQRQNLRDAASRLYIKYADKEEAAQKCTTPIYGYKGTVL